MSQQPCRWPIAAASAALLCGAALAVSAAGAREVDPGRQVPAAFFQDWTEEQLKRFFLLCSREAAQRMLTLEEGAVCSSAQDALKARSFGGDFSALLAWWRIHRDDLFTDEAR